MHILKYINTPITLILLSGCFHNNKQTISSSQNDIIIHQMRVEIEDLKHQMQNSSTQINILSKKIINTEDAILDLSQKQIPSHKQSIKETCSNIDYIGKELDNIKKTQEIKSSIVDDLILKIDIQKKIQQKNEKYIKELEKKINGE